ncbi:glycosyltransferase [Ectothiorhodospiraceae bacterium 2226]|nr:glycosyltransferase [Ectothiorhodospiraceae bacterium 2226]
MLRQREECRERSGDPSGRRLTVVHLSTVHSEHDTRIFEKQCVGLAAEGHSVTLVIQSTQDCDRRGVRIRALSPTKRRVRRMTVNALRALRIALEERADVYHLHDPELLPVGLALRMVGRRVVYDMHENVPKQIRTKHWIPQWMRVPIAAAVSSVERLTLNHMAVVCAERSYLSDYQWVRRRELVLNMPSLEVLETIAELPAEVPTIGYIGGVTKDRGVLTVLQAAIDLRHDGLRVNFECVGPVDDDVAADDRFRAAIADGWLRAPGRLPPQDGWRRIARCHVGVAVLRPLENYVDSYPTKMFEYMAMGLPVVVSDFALYRQVVDQHDCGLCVDPENVQSVRQALEALLTDAERARALGERGKRAVHEHYSWKGELQKLTDFYRGLLE